MSKKGGATGGAAKAKAGADLKRRGTGKDSSKLGPTDPSQPKEGDIYYRVVRSYPSFPSMPEETSITMTKPLDQLALSKENEGGKGGRKSAEGNRRGSVLTGEKGREDTSTPEPGGHDRERAASIAASVGGADVKKQQQRFVIWPEWNDADVNGEKWDVAHKGKEKGKSPVVQHFFDDPDGKIEMPTILKVETWKRPQDIVMDKPKDPVIVDADCMNDIDLMSANDHVHESELMRWITSQIGALWKMSSVKNTAQENGDPPDEEFTHTWRPWDHIYALNKVGKGAMYNLYGKYVVKLYWMGCWRKIVIDDTLPYDENDRLLLPATTQSFEIWPMLLTKALIKVAAIDYNGGSSACEFGDFSVIQCLTGWLPETIPLQYGHMTEIWDLLKKLLPEWKLPDLEGDKPLEGDTAAKDASSPDSIKDEKNVEREGKDSVKKKKVPTATLR